MAINTLDVQLIDWFLLNYFFAVIFEINLFFIIQRKEFEMETLIRIYSIIFVLAMLNIHVSVLLVGPGPDIIFKRNTLFINTKNFNSRIMLLPLIHISCRSDN